MPYYPYKNLQRKDILIIYLLLMLQKLDEQTHSRIMLDDEYCLVTYNMSLNHKASGFLSFLTKVLQIVKYQ